MNLNIYKKAGKFVRDGKGSVKLYDPRKKEYVFISNWNKLADAINANFEICPRSTWRINEDTDR